MSMKTLIPLALLLLLGTRGRAQTYVSVEPQDTLIAFFANLAIPGLGAEYDVVNYKMLYTTTDTRGMPDTASGMFSVPADSTNAYPLAVYMHGTVTDRDEVPSRLDTRERIVVAGMATTGFITIGPDYIGLGDSDGFHPYVHAESESRAGRDMIVAVRQWLNDRGRGFNDQLFITGYSQGGHAAMALHRDIQMTNEGDSLTVTAGAHLSGPYSISDVMRRAALSETDQLTLPGYIVYTYASYNNVYQIYDSLREVFREPYLEVIARYDNEEIDGIAFNTQLTTLLNENDDRLIDMFQDSIARQLIEDDDDSPLVQALRRNDTYEWVPEAPTLLYYCTEDEQVPFQNAILADSVMRALGSDQVILSNGGAFDHGRCFNPALTAALTLFRSLAVVEPVVSTGGYYRSFPELRISPNPVYAGETLRIGGLPSPAALRYGLFDAMGRSVQRGRLLSDASLPIARGLRTGTYVLRLEFPDGRFTARRIVLK